MSRASVVLLLAALAGCGPPAPEPGQESATLRVDQRLGAQPAPGFERAFEPRPFSFPDDHGAHPGFATEWWYFTGNLRDRSKGRFGYQLTLFRVGLKPGPPAADSDWRAHQLYMGHLAISDIGQRRHLASERFSRAAAGLAGASTRPLRVWLGPWSIRGGADALFPLRLRADTADFGIDLAVNAGVKPLVLQGDEGLSRKGAAAGNASYYYSFTRLPTKGELRLGERRYRVEGNSWFDREWSSSALAPDQAGWDWFALQLDDGRDLMFYRMRDRQGQPQRFSRGALVDRDGTQHPLALHDVELTPERVWLTDDGVAYPVSWRLKSPQHRLDLQIEASFDDQEMRQTVRYWEGAVTVSGSQRGVGYLELSGYAP